MVKRAFLIVSALAAGTALVGCGALLGLDREYFEENQGGGGAGGSSTGGGGTGGASTGGSGGTVCVPRQPPEAPAVPDDGGDIDFVVALHAIDLDEKSFDVKLGLDLDDVCTCEADAPPSCTPVADLVCDGPDGIDNALGNIFASVYDLSSGAITSGQISSAAGKGAWTNLLRIRGYNGKPDDAHVEVLVYNSDGVSAGMPAPLWDGTDAWPVDQSSLIDPMNVDTPLIVSSEAYVVGGVLVGRLPVNPLHLRGTFFAMNIDLVDVTFQAKLEALPSGQYNLTEGVMSAKWPLQDAFSGIASIRYVGGNKLCLDDDNYIAVKGTICGNADLRLDGQPGVCDTLSFGANFSSDAALLGPIVPPSPPPADACSPDTDPSNDTCD